MLVSSEDRRLRRMRDDDRGRQEAIGQASRAGPAPSEALRLNEPMVLIRRDVQRTATSSGAADFVSQNFMVTESMGPVCDRAQEQLGPTGRAINRMRHILISAAKGLPKGKEPRRSAGTTTGPSSARGGSSRLVRTGGGSPSQRTPPSPTCSASDEHSPPSER